MDIRRKIAHGGRDAIIERAAVRQVPAQTHARGADAAGVRGQRQQGVDGQRRVFVVRAHLLGYFPVVAFVRPGAVVG